MSNYLAIATVTSVLQEIIQQAVGVIPGALVSVQRPDKVSIGNSNKPGVNIFLYQIALNAAWLNTDIVIRRPRVNDPNNRAADIVTSTAQVPFHLNYLLSFYGDETKLETQRLLGSVLGELHLQPIFQPTVIQKTIQKTVILEKSDLAFQAEYIEPLKLSPLALSLEELSKLWSVFFQVPYVLSIAYQVSTVLIEPGSSISTGVVHDVEIGVDPEVAS